MYWAYLFGSVLHNISPKTTTRLPFIKNSSNVSLHSTLIWKAEAALHPILYPFNNNTKTSLLNVWLSPPHVQYW